MEHLKLNAQLPGDLNNALYTPHGKMGESKDGPGAMIHHARLMRGELEDWLGVILDCAEALFTIALATDAACLSPRLTTEPITAPIHPAPCSTPLILMGPLLPTMT
ncbi:MAG: hypothetical protein SGPRY_013636 [Prymnesium sp.]